MGRKGRVRAFAIGVAVALAGSLALAIWWSGWNRQQPTYKTFVPPDVQPVLDRYVANAKREQNQLAGYTDTVTLHAELPGLKKQGTFVLQRRYQAPNTVKFTPVRYTGDGFVRSNVILGYLSRQAHHIETEQGAKSAIVPANYTFQYAGREQLGGIDAYIFRIHPHQRGPGMFDGRIDVSPSGELLRAEGALVKQPSIFVKNARFVKDYGEFNGFWLPVHIHSESDTGVIGHAVMDVYDRDYQVEAAKQ